MTRTIEVRYTVSDGYVGYRPKTFKVDLENYRDMNADEIEEQLYADIQDHFEQHVTPEPDCDIKQIAGEILTALGVPA